MQQVTQLYYERYYMNNTNNLYGFISHEAKASASTNRKEKSVSARVTDETWSRWTRIRDKLNQHGTVELAGVVHSAFISALDALEQHSNTLPDIASDPDDKRTQATTGARKSTKPAGGTYA
jgi:hypothetical protein